MPIFTKQVWRLDSGYTQRYDPFHTRHSMVDFLTIIEGKLTEPQRQALLQVAGDCPVKATLLREISFKYGVA